LLSGRWKRHEQAYSGGRGSTLDVAVNALGIELNVLKIVSPDDLHTALQRLARERVKAVLVLPEAEAAAGFQSRRGRCREPTPVTPQYAAFPTYKTARGGPGRHKVV
jgi:hypothetical protein